MKIGLCGTMSVGKTTLVNELKKLSRFKDYTFRTERSKYLMEMGAYIIHLQPQTQIGRLIRIKEYLFL